MYTTGLILTDKFFGLGNNFNEIIQYSFTMYISQYIKYIVINKYILLLYNRLDL